MSQVIARNKLRNYLEGLSDENFSGTVTLNFFKGNLAFKVERKTFESFYGEKETQEEKATVLN